MSAKEIVLVVYGGAVVSTSGSQPKCREFEST